MKKFDFEKTTINGKVKAKGYKYKIVSTLHGWKAIPQYDNGAAVMTAYTMTGKSFTVYVEKQRSGYFWATEESTGYGIPSTECKTMKASIEVIEKLADKIYERIS